MLYSKIISIICPPILEQVLTEAKNQRKEQITDFKMVSCPKTFL